jgi:sirohydrochlorin cobaltochelatase
MSNSSNKKAVILVGHGGLPSDCSGDLVQKFMVLHKRRVAQGLPISKEEIELEGTIRYWPRTSDTDPYKAGLEELAGNLESLLEGATLRTAYNEFCAPSIEVAVKKLAEEGFEDILLTTTMLTPGGSHSEKEIPEEVEKLRVTYPNVQINYAWPFDLVKVAGLLAKHLNGFSNQLKERTH